MGVACDLGYPCALVFELEPMYATSDRQTDGRTTDADDGLMPPLRGGGIIIVNLYSAFL